KNSSTALSSHEGAFETSTTTWAPLSVSASPSPVSVLTPEEGEAGTTSWPRRRRLFTSFLPISPLPLITTSFIFFSIWLCCCKVLLQPSIMGQPRFLDSATLSAIWADFCPAKELGASTTFELVDARPPVVSFLAGGGPAQREGTSHGATLRA